MHKKNTDQLYYFHLDVMGSLVAITDESGILLESRNYDPWGKPRNPQTLAYTLSNPFGGSSSSYTLRGYTFHEHYEMFDLINMNGRLYDNQIGQFINADPILADNENLQNYNRYSYVMNNPLKYTDPSGYVYVGGGGAGTYGSGTSMEEISFNSRETEKFERGIHERQEEMKNETLAFLLSTGGAGPINPESLGYMLPEFSTAAPQAKQSGTNFSWAQSLRQDGNYMPYYQMGVVQGGGGVDFSNSSLALDIGGGIYGGLQGLTSSQDYWLGKNGKYYSNSWGGNQYTGGRSGAFKAASNYKLAGRATVIGSALIGVYKTRVGYQMDGGQFGYNAQMAAVSSAGSIAGGIAGAEAGALIGAGIGAWFGGIGAIPGAVIGGVIGGFGFGMAGGYYGGQLGGSAVNYYHGR